MRRIGWHISPTTVRADCTACRQSRKQTRCTGANDKDVTVMVILVRVHRCCSLKMDVPV
jgi:hypothetical protein